MKERIRPAADEILIVDDTPANLRLLSQMLSEHGYDVRAVTSGPRAIESVSESPPSLILLDIKMPDMDGYEVAREFKREARFADIPIIFISALDALEDKVEAFHVGGVDYITKPFQLEEVLARTETHLALRRYQQQLEEANRRFERELVLAGRMQASFLPSELLRIPGWTLSARLTPARETSGDFFDVFPLADGRYGILIGDVVDKGSGAAMFMVYCWSLMRTYADEHPDQPARVFHGVNRRINHDTASNQFVTAFYGVLNPDTAGLTYCSAGQCPGIHINREAQEDFDLLYRTGPPLGVIEDQTWEQRSIEFSPHDLLVLYTDGVTEAQSGAGEFFGDRRLIRAIQENLTQPVEQLEDGIISAVSAFVGDAAQFDDIAILSLLRGPV
jgi:sigma-B regulation protein RsbU (phosphoserine phosphatase)